jgi:hypothetical protein
MANLSANRGHDAECGAQVSQDGQRIIIASRIVLPGFGKIRANWALPLRHSDLSMGHSVPMATESNCFA